MLCSLPQVPQQDTVFSLPVAVMRPRKTKTTMSERAWSAEASVEDLLVEVRGNKEARQAGEVHQVVSQPCQVLYGALAMVRYGTVSAV